MKRFKHIEYRLWDQLMSPLGNQLWGKLLGRLRYQLVNLLRDKLRSRKVKKYEAV